MSNKEIYLLSETQLGFYYEWIKNPDLTEYNVPYKLILSQSVDANRLEKALYRVLHNNPIYYTCIKLVNGNAYQFIDTDNEITVERIKASKEQLPEIEKEFVRPFNLHEGGLARFTIVETEDSTVLLEDMHHCVSDGTSLVQFFIQLDMAYRNEPLPVSEVPYKDYITAEKESFKTEAYQNAKKYYKEKFADVKMTRTRLQLQDKTGNLASVSTYMAPEEIDKFCRERSLSPNAVFISAHAAALSVFSGEKKVAFYTINHGRNDRKFRKTFGCYVKSVPIFADLSANISITEFISTLKRELMNTVRYGIYPFSHFCQDLNMAPESSFTFHPNSIVEKITFNGKEEPIFLLPIHKVNCNFNVVTLQTDGDYEIRVEYNDARHTKFEMMQFAETIKQLVLNMVSMADESLSALCQLSEQSKEYMLSLSDGEKVEMPNETFLDMFTRQVTTSPDSTAVVCGTKRLTYQELDTRSDALAAVLMNNNVMRGDVVAIDMERDADWMTSIIAIYKCGAAYLSLSTDMPKKRKEIILEDSNAKYVISFDTLKTIEIGPHPQYHAPSLDDDAYIIYTSGSTGIPKGVVIQHKALASFIRTCCSVYGLSKKSRIFCHSSFCFDASVEDIFPVLTCGGELHILEDKIIKEPSAIAEYLQDSNISGGNFTTRFGVDFLRHYGKKLNLDYLTLGGERLMQKPETDIRVFNSYGPTEFTVDATFSELSKVSDYVPIGRPTQNCHAYVLDEDLHLLPCGCVGELYLSGPQLFREYKNKPEITHNVLIANPYKKDCFSEMMYKTGDLVWWNENGELEFVGRKDNQVKLNGFRIELGEIEHALSKCKGVSQSAVTCINQGNRNKIVAYYSSLNGMIEEAEIRKELAEMIPSYMMPSSIVYLEEFPTSISGKINYNMLKLPDEEEKTGNKEASTLEEKIVLNICRRVMECNQIFVDSNLFDFAMTSLEAMQISADADSLGIKLPVSSIYKHRTIMDALTEKQNLYFWADEADDSKPLVVLICGYPYFHPFYDNFIAAFKHKYSFFVLESYHEYFLWKDTVNVDILMDFYVNIIDHVLRDRNIYAITGYCIGSELAIHLARRLKQEGKASPKVLMMEGGYLRPHYTSIPQPALEHPLYSEHYRISNALTNSFPETEYDGEIIITLANNASHRLYLEYGEDISEDEYRAHVAEIEENKKNWKTHYPNAPFHLFNATHWTFFDLDNLQELVKIVEDTWEK